MTGCEELKKRRRAENPDDYDRAFAESKIAADFGQLVHDLRVRSGVSQTELARRMQTTQSTIARLELGGSFPTARTVARLAHALDAHAWVRIWPDESTEYAEVTLA